MEWKEKLYNHEVPPPENLWGKISHDLDNDSFVVFKQKLFHHEQEPPANFWKRIEQILYPVATVVSLKRNSFKAWRIAVAAALIGVAFFTANYFLSDTNDNPGQPVAKKPTLNAPGDATAPAAIQTDNDKEKTEPSVTVPVLASRHTSSKNNNTPRNSNTVQEIYSDGDNIILPGLSIIPTDESAKTDQRDLNPAYNRRIKNLRGEVKEDVSLLDLPNSYFLMTGPNGQSVRVSSKFRNTIQYLNNSGNEELLDVILRESQYWKNIFREWKEKVGNSSFVPSTENCMDITELMKLLQQNNNNK